MNTRVRVETIGTTILVGLLFLGMTSGCSKPPDKERIHVHPAVELVNPQRRTITRTEGQPGFIEAYEQTSLYPKVAGYIDAWHADIGDRIRKDQVLAHIFVPELEAQHREKQAQVVLDEVQIKVTQELVNVAKQNVEAAAAQIKQAKATVVRYQADVDRWQSEVKRLTDLASERVIDNQILTESRKQLKASTAARDASAATTVATMAQEAARKADLAKAKVDVDAARARVEVTRAAEQRLAALVSYTDVRAPYDGVVVVRNTNVGDYVQAATGDQSAPRSLQASMSSSRSAPLYIVARTDLVRIFLDVPEMDATGVGAGSKATVHIEAVEDEEIRAEVTRTSWALHARTRTLRVEVDLPNKGGRILPNMYAYGEVEVKRIGVWAVPLRTVTEIGNQNCFFVYEDGKAVQTPVQVGINDGKWIEVTRKREKGRWVKLTGKEQVIQADLSELTDGQGVRIEKKKSGDKEKE